MEDFDPIQLTADTHGFISYKGSLLTYIDPHNLISAVADTMYPEFISKALRQLQEEGIIDPQIDCYQINGGRTTWF